ncbi:MAG: pyruvate kinase [Acidobacteria bacterium]|nr:MAG: pyruvate kinase [Acidobacteriota bacterium]
MKTLLVPSTATTESRRAKIVCTLGPATDDAGVLAALLNAGMDVARLNFSHGSHPEHARRLRKLREVSNACGKVVAVMQDLQGPKIRTGPLEGGMRVELRDGDPVTITTRPVAGNARCISTTFQRLPKEVRPGNSILLSDGLIELRVERVKETEVECRVINGGELGEHQGINLPGVVLQISALTKKDREDLEFGIQNRVDYVALSFVRRADDILALKRILARADCAIPVVAKLEKPQAVDQLDQILRATDAVMVARGDLGVELPPETVPALQKRIIHQASAMRVPVITATQMLESMKVHPRPTRAETSDVANAVIDGTDALMLSGETATGHYPVKAVEMMARIITVTEGFQRGAGVHDVCGYAGALDVPGAICETVAHMAAELNLKAVAVFTQSGSSARLISKSRPTVPIFAFSPFDNVLRRTALYWGVTPVHMRRLQSTDKMVEAAARRLRETGVVSQGDFIAVIAGNPIAKRGSTNFLKVHRVTG